MTAPSTSAPWPPATDHRDADLLATLDRLTELRDQLEIARRRGRTAHNRVLETNCHECVALEAVIAATPALTSEGRRAKGNARLTGGGPGCAVRRLHGVQRRGFLGALRHRPGGWPMNGRRNLLTAAAASVMAALRRNRVGCPSPGHSPRAELIAACNEYIRIQREFEAYYNTPAGRHRGRRPWAWPFWTPSTNSARRSSRSGAVTAEGHVARAKCVAWHYLPNHRSCQDDPEYGFEDRFMAAGMRDLVADVQRGRAWTGRIGQGEGFAPSLLSTAVLPSRSGGARLIPESLCPRAGLPRWSGKRGKCGGALRCGRTSNWGDRSSRRQWSC